MRIAILGATGLVGQKVLALLSEGKWREHDVVAYATHGGGRTVSRGVEELDVLPLTDDVPEADFAFLAVPDDTARAIVPRWNEAGIRIIDKSSAYRMDPDVPLVVPEINGELITSETMLIANPNCSTIQLAMALYPLADEFPLGQIRVATYQAVSGAGSSALNAWRDEAFSNEPVDSPFPKRIHANVIPVIGSINEQGWATEELKVMQELPKILGMPGLQVSCTAVRVPVELGHSEAVEIRFEREVELPRIVELLEAAEGVVLEDQGRGIPTPLEAAELDEVFIGRLRLDPHDPHTLHLWVVSDNLRKGAATNAVQILDSWIMALEGK